MGAKMSKVGTIRVRREFSIIFLALVLIILTACSQTASKIEIGLSLADVKAILGVPGMVQEFKMPDQPLFFGPQEDLYKLSDPGTLILEWVYERGEEVLYVWFSRDPGRPTMNFRVIEFTTAPKDAIY